MKPNSCRALRNLLTLAAVLLISAPVLPAQNTVKPTSTQQTGFDVIGIEARTNNAKEATPDGAIGKQWQRLFSEGTLVNIPDRTEQAVTVVYTNYASDWNGDYTYILGSKVKPGTKAPASMVSVSVPGGKYLEFVSAAGIPQQVVPDVWKQIWTYFHTPGSPERAYKADFEVYEDLSNPNNIQAKVYIGVKP